jgi:hypothetical protein
MFLWLPSSLYTMPLVDQIVFDINIIHVGLFLFG